MIGRLHLAKEESYDVHAQAHVLQKLVTNHAIYAMLGVRLPTGISFETFDHSNVKILILRNNLD